MTHVENSKTSEVYNTEIYQIKRMLKICGILFLILSMLTGINLYTRRNLILGISAPIREINQQDICEAGLIDVARKDLNSPYFTKKLLESIKEQDFKLDKFLLTSLSFKDNICNMFLKSNNELMFFRVELIPDEGILPFKLNLVKQIHYKEIDEYLYIN